MPSFILKPNPEIDKYVMWSSVVDAPTDYGTVEKITNAWNDITPERIARADATGTSLKDGDYGWDEYDKGILIVGEMGTSGFYELPLKNLSAFMEELFAPSSDENYASNGEKEDTLLRKHGKLIVHDEDEVEESDGDVSDEKNDDADTEDALTLHLK